MRRSILGICLALFGTAAVVNAFVQTPAPAKTASQFYMEYLSAFEKAKRIEDLLPYMAAARRAEMEAAPAAERPKMFEFFKMVNTFTNVKIVKEDRAGEGATLTVEALDSEKKKATGTVNLVREKGEWKIEKESWKS